VSKTKEYLEAQLTFGAIAAAFGAWMVQVAAAVLAGIPTGAANWGEAGSNPGMLWGVSSQLGRFWLTDVLAWLALLSATAAGVMIARRVPRRGDDGFLVRRVPVIGWRQTVAKPQITASLAVMMAVSVVGIGLSLNPVAGVILGLLLASGPAVGFVFFQMRGGAEHLPGDRILLGAETGDRRRWVCARPDMSVFLLGAPSSGKTGGLMIPNLLQWEGVAVSTSTKMDIAEETVRHRSELGQAWIWAPLDQGLDLPAGAHRLNYSPISGAASWKVASRHAHALAYGTASGESSKVWASSASQLIACALHACAISGEGMQKVIDSVKQPEWRWLKRTLTDHPAADPQALVALGSLEGRNQTFRADMSANLDQALSLVLSGNLAEGGKGEELDWTEFLGGRNTLYVVLPTELPHVDPAPYVNVLLADLVYAVREVAAAHHYRLPHRLLMLLDELGALCSIDNLDNLIATQRSAGMSFLLSAQSLAQIDRRYGESGARTILDAVGAIVLGMGVSDDQALHDMETLVGGGVSLQQRMGSGNDDRQAIEDEADRWATHQIAALEQFHFYVHLKGSARPRHVRAHYFMDAPFKMLWEGTAGRPDAAAVEGLVDDGVETDDDYGYLDLTPLTRAVERAGRLMALVPGLDALANRWVEMVEAVWTRVSAPGLQLQMATMAAGQRAEVEARNLGHDVCGGNEVEQAPAVGPVATTEGSPVELPSNLGSYDDASEGMAGDGGDREADTSSARLAEDLPQLESHSSAQVSTPERTHRSDDSVSPPVRSKAASERPNRYAGACVICKQQVKASAGLTWRKRDRWLVRHSECRFLE
jgi:type IV secretion system protein VirD4